VSAQSYADPIARKWMAGGRCPECGQSPRQHSNDSRFWIPRACSLLERGVLDRIAQYDSEVSRVSGPYVEQTAEPGEGEPAEVRAEIVRILDSYFRYTLQVELDQDIPFCADEITGLMVAAEERGAAKKRERIAARVAVAMNRETPAGCACPPGDQRECGWRAGMGRAVDIARGGS